MSVRLAVSGGEGDRTPDLVNAIHALSQLSYAPIILGARENARAGEVGFFRRICLAMSIVSGRTL